jgi:hypothetical protein
MFQGLANGWLLIRESVTAFYRHPKLLVPLLITWAVYAPVTIYLYYYFDDAAYTTVQTVSIVLGVLLLYTLTLSFSCSILLELIQQLESGKEVRLRTAFKDTMMHNFIHIIPIVIVWTIIWFLLLVIQSLFSREKKREKESLSAESAARVLAGYGRFSFSRAFFEALEKGIRMVIFLILPAIAWENLSFGKAVKKGLAVLRIHISEFVAGFLLTGLATLIVFLPPIFLFYISDKYDVIFPQWVWVTTILYMAFAWSYSLYLEQMFSAELYLWNYKWEKEAIRARELNRPVPALKDIPKPSLLDEVHDLF